MSAPTARNRLGDEESAYLRQHADNPVNWQPWDEAALAAARDRDVPIFLSVGYAACHWCHVMADESFEDESVAALLNEEFVPIKVDREERPDLDRLYQTICQQVTGRGGWPLSVWLTPDGEPFYVGTYFPTEARRGQPGFRELLTDIRDSWTDPEQRQALEARAEEWADAIRNEVESVSGPDAGEESTDRLLETAAEAAVRGADREAGGWGRGPKFPHPGRIHVLLRGFDRTGREPFREVALEALDAMAAGGVYDHLGGGFHRYATDRDWTIPHFEKMLYDNAELPRAYLAAFQLTGRDRYRQVAEETFAFLQRELQHPEGGLFSTLDAQSEGEEGAYYVWTPGTVDEAIADDVDAQLFRDRYGVTEDGNFEGRTVLTQRRSPDALADRHDTDVATVEDRLERAREQAAAARAQRERPARDQKILAGWNGLAISALAEGAIVLDTAYAEVAESALSFVREHCWDADRRLLHRRYADGVVAIEGYLEDYAFLGRGAFDLFQATGEVRHLAFARALAREIDRRFWDPDDETLYFTPVDGEPLVAHPQEVADQSTPASSGVAAELLLQLSHFSEDDRFVEVAAGTIDAQRARIEADPLQHASLTLAADRHETGDLELTLVADDPPQTWGETLAARYLPRRVVAWRPADDDRFDAWLTELDIPSAPPIWADRGPRDGEPTVYACRSFTCSPPTSDVASALSWAGDEFADDGAATSEEAPF